MVVKIEVTQIKENIFICDLKDFQTNFETLLYKYLSQSDTN